MFIEGIPGVFQAGLVDCHVLPSLKNGFFPFFSPVQPPAEVDPWISHVGSDGSKGLRVLIQRGRFFQPIFLALEKEGSSLSSCLSLLPSVNGTNLVLA